MAERVVLQHQFRVDLDYGHKGFSLGGVTVKAEFEGDIDAPEPALTMLLAVGRRVNGRGQIEDDYTFLHAHSDPLFREVFVRAMTRLETEVERREVASRWSKAVADHRARIARYARDYPVSV